MDSLTHIAVGSAIGMAVMGARTPRWKAALWGSICATLPDLDTFIRHGDPVRDVTFHRAASHSLLYLTLLAPLIGWVIARIHRQPDSRSPCSPSATGGSSRSRHGAAPRPFRPTAAGAPPLRGCGGA